MQVNKTHQAANNYRILRKDTQREEEKKKEQNAKRKAKRDPARIIDEYV